MFKTLLILIQAMMGAVLLGLILGLFIASVCAPIILIMDWMP